MQSQSDIWCGVMQCVFVNASLATDTRGRKKQFALCMHAKCVCVCTDRFDKVLADRGLEREKALVGVGLFRCARDKLLEGH